jgi:aminoglycoside/choline kinase family phosphotransferase
MMVDKRRELLCEWIDHSTPYHSDSLEIASSDASFRRYFRLKTAEGPRIVMDSPPELEPCHTFIKIAGNLLNSGIQVPQIYNQQTDLGFLILSDFGDIHYQDAISSEQRNQLYDLAIKEIIKMQVGSSNWASDLPMFDRNWQAKELEIFREWCVPNISQEEFAQYKKPLIDEVDQIPKTFMHRDFHCRNLLVLSDGTPGIIDFQGAMLGPITYDLVSLLRDCYVDNSEEWINDQVAQFRTSLIQTGLLEPSVTVSTVKRWFDWSGLQRHLKCVGIFHRLKIRDGKPAYMNDVPRVLCYIKNVLQSYPELSDLRGLVDNAQILNPK